MPEKEQRLFDIDAMTPAVPVAERLAGHQRVFENTAVNNFREDIKHLSPVIERKLGSLASRGSVVMYGTEIIIPHLPDVAKG